MVKPNIIPFWYPILVKISPAGIDSKKYAPKNANCTNPDSKYDSVNISLNLEIGESTSTVKNPQVKKSDVTRAKALIYVLLLFNQILVINFRNSKSEAYINVY